MSLLVPPTIAELRRLVKTATDHLYLISPYVTKGPLRVVAKSIKPPVSLSLWTRLSVLDWIVGVSDPAALVEVLSGLTTSGTNVRLAIHQKLHAKCYFADDRLAFAGSANLTDGGFGTNVEALFRFEDAAAASLLNEMRVLLSGSQVLPLTKLQAWVDAHSDEVAKLRNDIPRKDIEKFQSSFESATRVPRETDDWSTPKPDASSERAFIEWLRKNPRLRASSNVHDLLVYNTNNNSGKARQAFFALYRFFLQNPDLIPEFVAAAKTGYSWPHNPSSTFITRWITHFSENGSLATPWYDYGILDSYLTPQFGGSRYGGGGGDTPFKRVAPLVAMFLQDTGA